MNGLPGPNPTETVTGGKTLELSKYDKVRKPHKAMEDVKIKVTTRTLSSELCCPICLDLLTCTMTTKECLHRFCSECITTALMRGNKECPTCRKKIVSKRSLRPDPNFDFLISKIWPDRKQYDAELNASMQLFKEQSNVQSLQKSIEEGIKAQAAYRKQRVQGSYDYEKRKRRPPRLAETAIQQQQGEETTSSSSLPVEQVSAPLAPVSSEGAVDAQQTEPTMEVDTDSDESEMGSDLSSDDLSTLSSDSSLSSSSSALSSSTIATTTVRISPKIVCTASPASAAAAETSNHAEPEQTVDEIPRKSEDIEMELVPSKRISQHAVDQSVPNPLKTSHFIRTSSDTTIAALSEFLFLLANQGPAESPSCSADNDGEKSEALAAEQMPSKSNTIPRPASFFIIDQRHQLHKMALNDCLGTALLNSIQWDRHLLLFFELGTMPDENLDIVAVAGEELLKTIGKGTAEIVMNRSMREASLNSLHPKADEGIKYEPQQNTSNSNEGAQSVETNCGERTKIPGGIEAEA